MISTTTRLALLLTTLAPFATATISFNSTFPLSEPVDLSLPSSLGISSSCISAYAADIPCSDWLILGLDQSGESEDDKFSNSTLEGLCTTECWSGLVSWRDEVKATCSADEVSNANETMYEEGTVYYQGLVILAGAMNGDAGLEYLYWPTCIRDLDTGDFCYNSEQAEESGLDSSFVEANEDSDAATIAAFCANSCITQASVFTWVVSGEMLGTEDINIADARELCPGLDTSKFLFLEGAAEEGSDNTSGAGGRNGTATNGTVTEAPSDSAAGALRVGWGVGSVAVAVVVGMGMM